MVRHPILWMFLGLTACARTAPLWLEEGMVRDWAIADVRLITDDFMRKCVDAPHWVEEFQSHAQRLPVVWIAPPSTDGGDVPAEAVAAAIAQSFAWRGRVEVSSEGRDADFALHASLARIESRRRDAEIDVLLAQFVVLDLVEGRVVCSGQGQNQRLASL